MCPICIQLDFDDFGGCTTVLCSSKKGILSPLLISTSGIKPFSHLTQLIINESDAAGSQGKDDGHVHFLNSVIPSNAEWKLLCQETATWLTYSDERETTLFFLVLLLRWLNGGENTKYTQCIFLCMRWVYLFSFRSGFSKSPLSCS